jgi:hypothetical protein
MKMVRKAFNYVLAYIIWIFTLLLGILFIIISREDFLGASSAFYVRGSVTLANRAAFYEKVFLVVLGLLWMGLMIVGEEYFRRGAQQGDLLRRIGKIVGPELLLLFAADLFLLWLQGSGGSNWLRWLILGFELIVGVVLLLYSFYLKPPKPA